MRITLMFSTGRVEAHVMRVLDSQRSGLVIACPWSQTPAATLAQVRHLLTDEEATEVATALGLTRPDGGS